jgi:hypothetical protein
MLDFTIGRWVADVSSKQWAREDALLASLPEALPASILESRPLAEVHRLDLGLFVVFEDAALRVSGVLTRRAPTRDALSFAAQQTLDEARHHEMFRGRFDRARVAAGLDPDGSPDAAVTPPMRRFLDHCYEAADRGSFTEGLALMNLVLEGMAYPLYAYEERYWQPVDPYLARMVRSAYADETRHVAFGAQLVRTLLADDHADRARVIRVCREARVALAESFQYYIRKFVGLFDAVAKRHRALFRDAELAPGRLIAETPYEEQIATIHHSIDVEHGRLLARAGIG